MADTKKELQKLFTKKSRYSNFGAAIVVLKVKGFRGISDLILTIESPITAISGLNGTGKSTIAQLATCAYKKPVNAAKEYKRQNISNYFLNFHGEFYDKSSSDLNDKNCRTLFKNKVSKQTIML